MSPTLGRAVDDAPLIAEAYTVQCVLQAFVRARREWAKTCSNAARRIFEAKPDRSRWRFADDLADVGRLRRSSRLDERIVDGALDLVFGHCQADAAMALGVHIDEESFLAEPSEAGGEIDAGCGFTATALLIDNRGPCAWVFPCRGCRNRECEGQRFLPCRPLPITAKRPLTIIGRGAIKT